MAHDEHFDAVVAGAGVAGCVAAAALSDVGLSVLMVEPGQRAERRLAGELLHPPGVTGLRALGFILPSTGRGTAPVLGFSVFHDRGASRPPTMLPYPADGAEGLAMDHGALRDCLATQVRARPGVTLLTDARVVDLDPADPDAPVVVVRSGTATSRIQARIVVGADGAASQVRAKAGIRHRRRALSTLVGFMADSAVLPAPGYGHLFLGAPRPVLAYATDADRARVMFDIPLGHAGLRRDCLAEALLALPPRLRAAMERAIPGGGLSYVSHEVSVDTVARGRILLVGDAGGSCHPLTATGMTVAVTDGLCLQAALREHPRHPHRALALYRRRRGAMQRARRLLASSLYETCSAVDPGSLLMRRGLERYWREEPQARAASVALLAMMDVRLASALREMVRVARYGAASAGEPGQPRIGRTLLLRQPRLALDVAVLMGRHMQAALWTR